MALSVSCGYVASRRLDCTPLDVVLGDRSDAEAVEVTPDGRRLFAAFHIDSREHQRRQDLGLGAIDSTGLLHGLWMLPSFVPVRAESLPPAKVKRLRDAPGWAAETAAGFERAYCPPGQVSALAVMGTAPRRQLERAAEQAAVFERSAIITSSSLGRVQALAPEGRRRGVGLYHVSEGGVSEVVPPARAILGRPGVFRWWIAELAYRSWLHDRTQLVS